MSISIELCILCDATESMTPYLRQVKEDIANIINGTGSYGSYHFRLAFVAYRDWADGQKRIEFMDFQENVEQFSDFVSTIKAEGGDDAAEDVLGGIQSAINLTWTVNNPRVIKLLYHICDAPPHGTIYHDLFNQTSKVEKKFISGISGLFKDYDIDYNSDDDSDDSDEDDGDAPAQESESDISEETEAFVGCDLSLSERRMLDKYPNGHPSDTDHTILLQSLLDRQIQYCIGEKRAHVQKMIGVFQDYGDTIGLDIKRVTIPNIKQLLPSVKAAIDHAIRLTTANEQQLQKQRNTEPKRLVLIKREGNFKVHVGIDFGTDGSAYAIARKANDDNNNNNNNKSKNKQMSTGIEVFVEQDWGIGNKPDVKTKTNILLDRNGSLLAFGDRAAQEYLSGGSGSQDSDDEDNSDFEESDTEDEDEDIDEDAEEPADDRMFFEHFKMALYGNANHNATEVSSEETKESIIDDIIGDPSEPAQQKKSKRIDINEQLRATNGQFFSSQKILSAALGFMKRHVMKKLAEPKYNITNMDEVRWILTVPAIWSEKAKWIMIRCAEDAGLINVKKRLQNQLLLAFEPDCASMCIRSEFQDKYQQRMRMRDDSKEDASSSQASGGAMDSERFSIFKQGDKYLLLDLGGGTADIACHEVESRYYVKEIREPSGGPWGSTYIDKEFERLLFSIFSKEWINSFRTLYPNSYVEFLKNFRTVKEKFDVRHISAIFESNAEQLIAAHAQQAQEEEEQQQQSLLRFERIEIPFAFFSYMQTLHRKKQKESQSESGSGSGSGSGADSSMDGKAVITEYCAKYQFLSKYGQLIRLASKGQYLEIEQSVMRYLFDVVVNKIVDHCKMLISEMSANTDVMVIDEDIFVTENIEDDISVITLNAQRNHNNNNSNQKQPRQPRRKSKSEEGYKYICLVGGFSESRYVQQRIFHEFGARSRYRLKIVTPNRPILAVVEGAARIGLRPDYISSRTVTKTYGIAVETAWTVFHARYPSVELHHSQLNMSSQQKYVKNCFFPFVRKYDVIRLDSKPVVQYFVPASADSNIIHFKLYASEAENDPIFVTDDACELAAAREIELPSNWREMCGGNAIPIQFYFGDTIIHVFIDIPNLKQSEKEIQLRFDTAVAE